MVRLDSLTDPRLIFPELRCTDAAGVLRLLAGEIVAVAAERFRAHPETAWPAAGREDELFQKLWEREQLLTTAIGSGVAIPHCKIDGLGEVLLAVGLLAEGVDFGAADCQPVRLFFCVVSPESSPAAHLQCLASISKWIRADRHVERILELRSREEIFELLKEGGA